MTTISLFESLPTTSAVPTPLTVPPFSGIYFKTKLPLTTTFTRPSDCFQTWAEARLPSTVLIHDGEARGYYVHGQPKAGDYVASCYPPRLYGGWLAVVLWSPGVCPSNYFAVSTSVVGATTVAGCCSRYIITHDNVDL